MLSSALSIIRNDKKTSTVVVAHVHAAVKHNVLAADGDEHTAASHVLSRAYAHSELAYKTVTTRQN